VSGGGGMDACNYVQLENFGARQFALSFGEKDFPMWNTSCGQLAPIRALAFTQTDQIEAVPTLLPFGRAKWVWYLLLKRKWEWRRLSL